jgi:transcriptional regulator with XRE-family HTH domain
MQSTNAEQLLKSLMQLAGIPSFKALSRQAGVSERQITRLRQGKLAEMRIADANKLSQILKISLNQFLATFGINPPNPEITVLQQEYQRLQTQMAQQQELLTQEFQTASLQVLESFLVYWPTAESKARENPEMAAVKLLPLVRPVQQLLQQWGVEAIAPVGAEVPFEPQWHQLIQGTAQPGEPVKIRNPGYRHHQKLLLRAQVSPLVR